MSSRPLRFIHSSDWHLERPLAGVADAPEPLRSLLCDAPYLAAERVVDAAIAERVDFLLLAGDVLDVELAGPRGVTFLIRQFERLRERRIEVYWAGGRNDHPSRWPAAIELPDNVHRFSARRPEEAVFARDDQALVRIVGLSRHRSRKVRAEDFWPDAGGLPSIALAHGPADRAALASRALTYWALGGKHAPATLFDSPHVAQYCGSPQGRRPNETSPHGCTLVEIDDAGRVQARLVATDVVRRSRQRITVDAEIRREEFEQMLAERAEALAAGQPPGGVAAWLVSWTVAGHGPLIASLRRGSLAAELLAGLQRKFAQASPIVWSVELELEAASAVPPGWLERDWLLGDYLRSLSELETDDGLTTRLESLFDGAQRSSRAARVLAPTSEAERLRILQIAAALGAELIGGEETMP